MIPIILAAGFIFLTAFFNSCMDAFENTPNFDESIFKHWKKEFWCKDVSWAHVPKILGYRPDAWHLAKTCMVVCLAGAIAAALLAGLSGHVHIVHWYWWVKILAFTGIVWNGTFMLFYNVIFKIR